MLVQGCPLLEEISGVGLCSGDITTAAIANHCTRLRRLKLVCVQAEDDTLIALVRNNPGLQDLTLRTGYATTDFLRELALNCRHLMNLSLINMDLTIASIHFLLRQCPCLTSLSFENLDVSEEEVAPPPGSLAPTGLRCLSFEGADITGVELTDLLLACPSLTTLFLCNCGAVENLQTLPLGAWCPGLQEVSLYDNGSVAGDITLWHLSRHCPDLRALRIPYGLFALTDIGVHMIVTRCPLLESLHVQKSAITDLSLCYLAQHGRNIRTLRICECVEVTDAGIEAVMMGCTKLTHFSVEMCTKLTAKLKQAIYLRYDDPLRGF
jgi:hypothetical protein